MRPLIALFLLSVLCLILTSAYFVIFPSDDDVHLSGKTGLVNYDGDVISAKMGNATQKAEVGRSTWKLLHTMAAQYPENPTTEERQALHQFFLLLSRLYPCGECAAHFQLLLQKYPPQTSSRIAASQWACAIHNKVNERLGKEIFDCSDIQDKYDCGCAEDGDTTTAKTEEST
ncbi:FAD-linked sulfhydryl oxidase-like protein ERV2 [Zychaea mexicana]|uniref:FAD-linked sulfhydryl oxidase-like protein ERV2 n=1 Tax=Zychaea mexicana TaxID=64656 RepID=UPI0022FE5472|nr:FAD-linked sulfhydryl oxidase-like protein ERV2 [Zychaea mexicana]KAI9492820.1 FAD-linked sulfhydryl oxidase-like protein ERV2 [Zychaea mexicana]